ncbi:MAG: SDR family NAD(P)-dependent oxidoreductase [Planctomycetota bacterium]|jgi:UDP-glucose 4-epimerase
MSPPTTPDFRSVYAGRCVCVTGGAGFIGSHLCQALVRHGARVRVIDDLSNGRRENLESLGDQAELVEASILDRQAMAAAAEQAQVIFHLAAVASVPRSVAEPELYVRVNVDGTVSVLEAARACGAKRVVFASSSSVYGDQPRQPKVETMTLDPRSPYAASKCAGEQFVRAYARCYPLSAVSLRYFNVFGPRQRPDSPYAAVIPLFADALGRGRRATIYGDGAQTRDFTHVDNAVHANLLAGASPRDLEGEAVNIATGRASSVLELLRAVAEGVGVEPAYETAPPRPGDVLHSLAGLERARDLLGYEPVADADRGLRETVRYYLDLLGDAGAGNLRGAKSQAR